MARYRPKIIVPVIAGYIKKALRAWCEFHHDGILRRWWWSETMSLADGYSTEILGLESNGDLEGRMRSANEREIHAPVQQSVLGWWRHLGTMIFASMVGINEATIQQYVRHQGEQEMG
jgi:hypothetical protein